MSASAYQYLPGPLHPDLFEPELTPSLLAVEDDAPRWRAEILDTRVVWVGTEDLSLVQRTAKRYTEESGAAGYEILGIRRDYVTCCAPEVLLAVELGFTYHLDVAADDSHEALAIAQHIATRRWPGSEVIGVDLILPQASRSEEHEK